MPEIYFDVRWPDGQQERCYSPSLVIQDHLDAGARYPVGDFVQRCETALGEASERVKAKYGFYCSSAMDQLTRIKTRAEAFDPSESEVLVEGFKPGAR